MCYKQHNGKAERALIDSYILGGEQDWTRHFSRLGMCFSRLPDFSHSKGVTAVNFGPKKFQSSILTFEPQSEVWLHVLQSRSSLVKFWSLHAITNFRIPALGNSSPEPRPFSSFPGMQLAILWVVIIGLGGLCQHNLA